MARKKFTVNTCVVLRSNSKEIAVEKLEAYLCLIPD